MSRYFVVCSSSFALLVLWLIFRQNLLSFLSSFFWLLGCTAKKGKSFFYTVDNPYILSQGSFCIRFKAFGSCSDAVISANTNHWRVKRITSQLWIFLSNWLLNSFSSPGYYKIMERLADFGNGSIIGKPYLSYLESPFH